MKTAEADRVVLIAVFMMVAFNGIFLSVNGLFMLVAPATWYDFVPGVSDTGFFNQHFIRDIGIIQLFLGVAFGVGMIRPERRIGLWAGATLWLSAHAAFHLWEVAVGICSPSVMPRDFPAGDHRRGAYPLGHPSISHQTGSIHLSSGRSRSEYRGEETSCTR